MPGTKRKASFAFPCERPSRRSKRSSSTTVSKISSTITRRSSVVKPPRKTQKYPSQRASKMGELTKVSTSAPPQRIGGSPTLPVLRRASTLTLEDDGKGDSTKTTLTKRKSSTSKPVSLSKMSSSFVEEGALVTKLSGLRSGSIVGETSLVASTQLNKSLSRKSSSLKPKIPSVPSGLTNFALPKGGSESSLASVIDETEMRSALETFKTHLSKEGSISSVKETTATKRKMSKSASVRSTSSVKETTETDKGEDMDTTTSGPSSDGVLEVAISLDTTGSMYDCLEEVGDKVKYLVQRLQTDIPGIRVAIIAHGNYCDESNYVIKWIDFGATLSEISDFVKTVGRTGGGDGPECYELVLQRSREVLSWTPGSKRILVMIGDNVPHEPGYTYGGKTYYINWRDECAALNEMGVKIYGVQAGFDLAAVFFNEEMARITGGKRLSLRNLSSISYVLMMICYREGNSGMLAVYEQEIIDRGKRMAEDITSIRKSFDMETLHLAPASTPFGAAGFGRGVGTTGIGFAPPTSTPFSAAGFGRGEGTTGLGLAPPISTPFSAAGFGRGEGTTGLGLAPPISTPFSVAGFGIGEGTTGLGLAPPTSTPTVLGLVPPTSIPLGAPGFNPTSTPFGATGFNPTSTPFGATGLGLIPPKSRPFGATGIGLAPPTSRPFGATGIGLAPPTLTPFCATGIGLAPPTLTPFGATGIGLAPPTSTLFGATAFGTGAAGIKTFKPTAKKREKLPDSCMNQDAMKDFIWSEWICGVEPNMPTSKQKSNFVKLRTNQGYGPKTIFDGNLKIPAIYEVAIQLPGSRKKYVVYFRILNEGLKQGGFWSTNLLSDKLVKREVSNVLRQGCSIYIRRGVPKATTTDAVRSQMQAAVVTFRDNFDYAWVKYIWRRSEDQKAKFKLNHRFLKFIRKRCTYVLSHNNI